MKREFTPGPWINDGYYNGNHMVYKETENDSIHIISVQRPIHDSERLTKAQAKGNAQLIAAAPDLLEALQEFISEADFYDDDRGHNGKSRQVEVHRSTVDKAKAAIAKAIGIEANTTEGSKADSPAIAQNTI